MLALRLCFRRVERTGGSRSARRQIERHRRLAPVADLTSEVIHAAHANIRHLEPTVRPQIRGAWSQGLRALLVPAIVPFAQKRVRVKYGNAEGRYLWDEGG